MDWLSTLDVSYFTFQSEKEVKACLKRLNRAFFLKNPTQALKDAGLKLNKDVTFMIISNNDQIVPDGVIPIKLSKHQQKQLSLEDIHKACGGFVPTFIENIKK